MLGICISEETSQGETILVKSRRISTHLRKQDGQVLDFVLFFWCLDRTRVGFCCWIGEFWKKLV
ncbi:hypothetical protein Pint_25104 [Pistacia integerrima]|uniref:Uncharacterized protein n=1 Tax=Pistacia integerrima TaxID=434235 RepID=A0ACC0YHA7_9ROSI|nr:hypothetical protein Pint_25104 [Pistacia integerrima]